MKSFTAADVRQRRAELGPFFEAAPDGRALGIAAERLADRCGELRGSAVSTQISGTAGSRRSQADLDAVRRVRIDDHAVTRRDVADRREPVGVRAASGHEARGLHVVPVRRAGEVEAAFGAPSCDHSSRSVRRVASDRVEDEAFEVRRLRDVHRRRRRRVRLAGRARTVAAGAEELVEHVVLVGGEDQPPDRQPHFAARRARQGCCRSCRTAPRSPPARRCSSSRRSSRGSSRRPVRRCAPS